MMQSSLPGSPSRRLLLAAAFLGCGLLAGRAAGGDPPPAAAERVDPAGLARREQELARQFRDLEKTFLRLADLLATSDPRRAAVLRSVFARAREEEVGDRLDTIVQLLEKGQLLKAGTSQAGAIEKMRLLLYLLESGDTDRRLANTKEEVKQFITRLSKLISRQRDIEGSTEAGAGEAQLSERQQSLAEETRGLSEEIGGFARRMDSRQSADGEPDGGRTKPADGGPEGQPSGRERQGGEGKKGGEGDGNEPGRSDREGESPASPAEKGGPQRDGEAPESPAGGSSQDRQKDGDEPQPVEGERQEGGAEDGAEGDDEASRARRTRRRLEAAEQRMRQAQQRLDQAKRRDARGEQEKAI